MSRCQALYVSNEVENKDGTAEGSFLFSFRSLEALLLMLSKGAKNSEKDPHDTSTPKWV